ncbi:hypothetical protein ACEWY4_013384 [Coilia grayii]|uniref:Uncharacterized protein n=1 Tax=Coilia grayii TaxID=363190 RepID=A0ABD1JW58_9TELE
MMNEKQPELIQPKKVVNPLLESSAHRGLLKELLLTHKWGMWPGERSELQKVLEQRRVERHREQELSVSELETKLRKQKRRLLAYELEEMRRTENPQNVPEFMRVRENLRRFQL